MGRLLWTLKQLTPRTYWTTYTVSGTSQERFCIWKMWLGRCYAVVHVNT